MLVAPVQFSVSELMFVAQLADLQSSGYLTESTVDFNVTLEASLRMGYEAMGSSGQGAWPSSAPRFLSREALEQRLAEWVGGALRFRPFRPSDFPPLQAVLPYGNSGARLPVVIEKATFDQARQVLKSGRGREELEEFALLEKMDLMAPLVFFLRDWKGEAHAMAIAALHPDGENTTMLCCRDLKFDRDPRSALQNVGAVLTLARLLFMKNAGHWSDTTPILNDIQPAVLESYRARFPKPLRRDLERGQWHIARAEAEHLLVSSPIALAPIPALS